MGLGGHPVWPAPNFSHTSPLWGGRREWWTRNLRPVFCLYGFWTGVQSPPAPPPPHRMVVIGQEKYVGHLDPRYRLTTRLETPRKGALSARFIHRILIIPSFKCMVWASRRAKVKVDITDKDHVLHPSMFDSWLQSYRDRFQLV